MLPFLAWDVIIFQSPQMLLLLCNCTIFSRPYLVSSFMLSFDVILFCYNFPHFCFLKTRHTRFIWMYEYFEVHHKFQKQLSKKLYSFLQRLLVSGEEKIFLHWADKSSQGRTKISYTGMLSPMNQPRKDPFQMYSLSPHLPQFQQ